MDTCYFKKIPTCIILKILSYTYKFQPKDLLDDIKNYYKTKKYLLDTYYKIYSRNYRIAISDSYDWLVCDLYRYLNSYISIENELNMKISDIYSRYFIKKKKVNIDQYIKIIYRKCNNKSELNRLIGIMYKEERIKFIKYVKMDYNL